MCQINDFGYNVNNVYQTTNTCSALSTDSISLETNVTFESSEVSSNVNVNFDVLFPNGQTYGFATSITVSSTQMSITKDVTSEFIFPGTYTISVVFITTSAQNIICESTSSNKCTSLNITEICDIQNYSCTIDNNPIYTNICTANTSDSIGLEVNINFDASIIGQNISINLLIIFPDQTERQFTKEYLVQQSGVQIIDIPIILDNVGTYIINSCNVYNTNNDQICWSVASERSIILEYINPITPTQYISYDFSDFPSNFKYHIERYIDRISHSLGSYIFYDNLTYAYSTWDSNNFTIYMGTPTQSPTPTTPTPLMLDLAPIIVAIRDAIPADLSTSIINILEMIQKNSIQYIIHDIVSGVSTSGAVPATSIQNQLKDVENNSNNVRSKLNYYFNGCNAGSGVCSNNNIEMANYVRSIGSTYISDINTYYQISGIIFPPIDILLDNIIYKVSTGNETPVEASSDLHVIENIANTYFLDVSNTVICQQKQTWDRNLLKCTLIRTSNCWIQDNSGNCILSYNAGIIIGLGVLGIIAISGKWRNK